MEILTGLYFFDFWFDYKGYVPSEYVDLFERLKNLSRAGVQIHYVLGNHDFWDFGFFKNNFSTQTWNDFDTILVGHYHQDGIFKKENKKLIFLGDWLNKFSVTKYDKGVWTQVKWDK